MYIRCSYVFLLLIFGSMMSSISMLSLIPEIHIAGGGIGVAFCKSFYMNRNPDCPSSGQFGIKYYSLFQCSDGIILQIQSFFSVCIFAFT